LNFTVPSGINSLLFNFYFISEEYDEYIGLGYNDNFTATISGLSKVTDGTNVAKDANGNPIEIDSPVFIPNEALPDLAGTSFSDGGGTGWIIAGAPVAPGDNIFLAFKIADVGDGVYDSTVLLDNFRFDQGVYMADVQSGYFFSQSIVNITDCSGQATLDLYSATVVRSATQVDIGNSNPNVLATSTNQLTIPAYQSKTSDSLAMQGLKNGSNKNNLLQRINGML